jgi:uncharacterized SAM-binding protein YcdF (DUF218 family)
LPGPKRAVSKRPLSRTHRPASRRPVRRPHHRTRLRLPARVALASAALLIALITWAIIARAVAPLSNSSRQSFDAIIVLGTPADSDGNPTPELLDRITEGVHEYERGVAPRLIVTGAAAHNHFVEAEVMARVAQAQGVPASAILQEPRALDTIQNACYSARILQTHGWHSVEVISSASHLPRAAMIFSHLPGPPLQWRMHAAPDNLTPGYYSKAAAAIETLKTARYLIWSRWIESCDQ